jgi:two-component system, LytTR family, response regulator
MRVLIVDDERRARRRLAELLAELGPGMPGLEVAGEAGDGLEALEMIESLRPDVVLLDVQMPRLDGFEVVAELAGPDVPQIIFVTGYEQYALRAFEVSAVDFLLKPVEAPRLSRALAKAARNLLLLAPAEEALAQLRRLAAAVADRRPQYLRRVLGGQGGRLQIVPVETVEAFVAERYEVFALTDAGRLLVRLTLHELEKQLDPGKFARAHKHAIVNLDRVVDVGEAAEGGVTARLGGGACLTVSRRLATEFRERVGGRLVGGAEE